MRGRLVALQLVIDVAANVDLNAQRCSKGGLANQQLRVVASVYICPLFNCARTSLAVAAVVAYANCIWLALCFAMSCVYGMRARHTICSCSTQTWSRETP